MNINAIIFGASGMVGEGVLIEALNSNHVDSVLVIGRRPCGITHPKLKELIHRDFFDFSSMESQLTGYNACFFCLGTTSVGKNEQDYTRTTYDLTMAAATTLARLNPAMTFCYVSGKGTDSTEKGKMMWARVKGKTENDLAKLPFKAAYMFRPGLMKPVHGQRNLNALMKFGGMLYPLLKMLSPGNVCELSELGRAMIQAAAIGYSMKHLESREIRTLAAVR